MRCPFCQEDHDKVIDSRSTDGGRVIRRRRQCIECSKRFTTYEHVEEGARLMVVKKDGSRVPYAREKLMTGLEKACYKRPISVEALTRIVEQVEDDLFHRNQREIPSLDIGQALAERLKYVDQVAYVRFASVYKHFRDLDDLLDEVRDVLEGGDGDRPEQGQLF